MPTLQDSSATTRAAICTEALSWVGTPYRHQACLKGIGVDCVGLIVGIAQACGLLSPGAMLPPYSPEWHLHQREEQLLMQLDAHGLQCIDRADWLPGDVLVFQYTRRQARRQLPASHLALGMPDGRMVHALLEDQVRHHTLAGSWLRNLRYAYTFLGVAS